MLARLAKKLPIFPDINNERSMLYIDNLCEFLCQVMLVDNFVENAVVFLPQNGEWTNTSQMVEKIAEVSGNKMIKLKILKPVIFVGSKIPGKIGGLVNKAFGNSCYIQEVSQYEGINYQIKNLQESILRTEKSGQGEVE